MCSFMFKGFVIISMFVWCGVFIICRCVLVRLIFIDCVIDGLGSIKVVRLCVMVVVIVCLILYIVFFCVLVMVIVVLMCSGFSYRVGSGIGLRGKCLC